jgi:hypothetical protein
MDIRQVSGSSDVSSDSQSSLTPLAGGKIAIPRLSDRPGELRSLRTTRACVPCHEKKAKCNGQQPKCRTCQRMNRVCTYAASKRDTQRLKLRSLQQKAQVYETLLGEIISQATIHENISIENVVKVCHQPRPN